MIKDNLNLSFNFDEIQLVCSICNNKNQHIEKNCPIVHYVPDKEAIIKRYVFP
jgi:hypothetical protein